MGTRPFRFGVIAETYQDRRQWLSLGCEAEQLGYDTLLVRDHIAPAYFGPQFAPMIALAALASVTSTLRLGNFVIDNDFRHPAILAKEAATLDVLSAGRYELGIGAGWLREEYQGAGLTFEPNGVRIDRLEESLQVLKRCFTEEEVGYAGVHYSLDRHHHYPAPITPGGPPIMIGAGKPRMLRLAGRYADIVSLLTVPVSSGKMVEEPAGRRSAAIRAQIDLIAEGAGERFPEIELSIGPMITITDDPAAARQRLIATQGWDAVNESDVQDMPGVMLGTIEQICDRMEAVRADLGISYFVIPDRQMRELAPVVERLSGR